jgi:hypothetical protein
MNTQGHDTDPDAGRDSATVRAERGTAGWEDAVRLQRWATPEHADFYALAGEIVSTLYALDDLTQVLHRQVSHYGQGRRLYDDTRQVDPAARLVEATAELADLRAQMRAAQAPANRFWSVIGHIGVEPAEAGGVTP